jgi:amidohydrolase
MDELSDLLRRAKEMSPKLVEIRRDLHRHPELGFEERRTAQRITEELADLHLQVHTGVGRTGVVAILEGGQPGPAIGLRACLDALPIQEATGAPYASEMPAVSHACGHEAQCVQLVGAARLVAPMQDRLAGRIAFIFQPAEEIDQGAKAMLADGLLDLVPLDAIFGVHGHPDLKVGTIGIRPGSINASIDTVTMHVRGHYGHGAFPHRAIDAVLAASSIVTQLQSVVARNVDPLEPAVVTIGTFHAGKVSNVVADQAELSGTIRCASPAVRALLFDHIRRVAEGTATALGAKCELEFTLGIPSVVNNQRLVERVRRELAPVIGSENIVEPPVRMGGDDFSVFAEKVPGCYIHIGFADPGSNRVLNLHTAEFDFDERALAFGSFVLAAASLMALGQNQ